MRNIFAPSKSRLKTRDFIDQLGNALRAPEQPGEKLRCLIDTFGGQLDKTYATPHERAAKLGRVVAKLQAKFPALTVGQLQRHAPALAKSWRPTSVLPAEVEAAQVAASNLLSAAKSQAAVQLETAAVQARKLKAEGAAVLAEAEALRSAAQQSATGILANAERESAKRVRKAEAELATLQEQKESLERSVAALAAPLRTQLEHRFKAGGFTFHAHAAALEQHPESYLAMLVRADQSEMSTQKGSNSVYQVDDITADELKALCHFLNTGTAIGPLLRRDATAEALITRFGSESMARALKLTLTAQARAKLNVKDVKRHCRYNGHVESLAQKWANKLARELPLDKWADQSRFDLDVPHPPRIQGTEAVEVHEAISAGPHDAWELDTVRASAQAIESWFEEAGFKKPTFVLTPVGYSSQLHVIFHSPDAASPDDFGAAPSC